MYLAERRVQNFRCLRSLRFKFLPALNVILGEKPPERSVPIDALRLILLPGLTFRIGPDEI